MSEDIMTGFPDLTRITRYCEPLEISKFIRNINVMLEDDRQRLSVWSREYEQLIKQVDVAGCQELRSIHDHFNRIEMERFLLTCSVKALHANCTHYRDEIATRALKLVAIEMESSGRPLPEIPFALVSMGSDGREEQTLITDQDYLI
ncbi:MAG: DUF294 nucleotidyltransferase-like domain-containing protein, partial [Deltaproteobacteria bacterium]